MYIKEIMALLSVKGVGIQTFCKILNHYGNMAVLTEAIIHNKVAKDTGLKATEGIDRIYHHFSMSQYNDYLLREKVELISFLNASYPTALKELEQFPPLLHYRGCIEPLNEGLPIFGVVGSRKITDYGQKVSLALGRFLGAYKVPVISGLAYGVDYEVHRGVLMAGGFPVAVLANGLDKIYPKAHHAIGQKIATSGLLLTEEFLYSDIAAYKFPIRNRIISGLSDAIIVVEAEKNSGSLITAQHGLEQGKQVFAVPGSIYSDTSKGTNQLISDGAIPLTDFEQLVEMFHLKNSNEAYDKEEEVLHRLTKH